MVAYSPSAARDGKTALTFKGLTLAEVAAAVSNHLERRGINVLVVGGSAITVHIPDVYTSMDIDFVVLSGLNRARIRTALLEIGFSEQGRVFQNPDTPFVLDFVADTPFVDQRPITSFHEMGNSYGRFQVFHLEDAIADRVAAFIHWSDSQSLDVAERALAAAMVQPSWKILDHALSQLEILSPEANARLNVARDRLRKALKEC